MLVCRPPNERIKQTRICFSFGNGLLFCFFCGRTNQLFPGRSPDGQPARRKKGCWACPEGIFTTNCPAARLFFFGPFVFFLARRTNAPWTGGICFFVRQLFFSWACFLNRTNGRTISWLGPGRQTNNQIHVPLLLIQSPQMAKK